MVVILKTAAIFEKFRWLMGFLMRSATVEHHTSQCKSTGGCYNELVMANFRTVGGVKWQKR